MITMSACTTLSPICITNFSGLFASGCAILQLLSCSPRYHAGIANIVSLQAYAGLVATSPGTASDTNMSSATKNFFIVYPITPPGISQFNAKYISA